MAVKAIANKVFFGNEGQRLQFNLRSIITNDHCDTASRRDAEFLSGCGCIAYVVSPGDLITGSGQEGVCGYLAVCRSLGLLECLLEVGSDCIITPSRHVCRPPLYFAIEIM